MSYSDPLPLSVCLCKSGRTSARLCALLPLVPVFFFTWSEIYNAVRTDVCIEWF